MKAAIIWKDISGMLFSEPGLSLDHFSLAEQSTYPYSSALVCGPPALISMKSVMFIMCMCLRDENDPDIVDSSTEEKVASKAGSSEVLLPFFGK